MYNENAWKNIFVFPIVSFLKWNAEMTRTFHFTNKTENNLNEIDNHDPNLTQKWKGSIQNLVGFRLGAAPNQQALFIWLKLALQAMISSLHLLIN